MLWVSHVLALTGPLDQTSDSRLGQLASRGGYPSFLFVAAVYHITYSSPSQQSLYFRFEGPFGIG